MSEETRGPEPEVAPRKLSDFPTIIAVHLHLVWDELQTIRRYLETVTSSFAREFNEYEEHLRKLPNNLTDEEAECHGSGYAEMESLYVDRFPAFALETTFVATYAFLEDEMMEVCRFLGDRLKIKLGPEELRNKGIEAAKTYLEKLCDLRVPNERPWQEAQHYGRLRNVFSHTQGCVKEGNDKVRKYVAANADKLSIEDGRLRITKEFCLAVVDDVENLLTSLLRLAQARITEK